MASHTHALAKAKPGLKEVEPFKTVLSGNREAMAKFTTHELEEILGAALTGMTMDEFKAEVQTWLTTAKDPRWHRPYTELTYQPMQEVLKYLRANGYKTYIVTGGGQDFVRVDAEKPTAFRRSRLSAPWAAPITVMTKRADRYSPKNPNCCSMTTTRASRKAFI